MEKRGYVYVLTNPAMPGLVKIGRSIDGGKARARQIYQTGVPQPFTVVFEMMTDDYEYVEQMVHEGLSEWRVSGSREFFKADIYEAVTAVITACLSLFDMTAVRMEAYEAIEGVAAAADRINVHPILMYRAIRHVSDDAARDCYETEMTAQAERLKALDAAKKAAH